jgi:hypothetical protein
MSTLEITTSVKQQIPVDWKEFDLFSISYGAIPHVLIEESRASRNIFMSPVFGDVKWRLFERFVGTFFPLLFSAMQSIKSEKFKGEVFLKTSSMKNVIFILPEVDGKLDDGRISFDRIVNKMRRYGKVFTVFVKLHKDPIRSRKVSEKILELLNVTNSN